MEDRGYLGEEFLFFVLFDDVIDVFIVFGGFLFNFLLKMKFERWWYIKIYCIINGNFFYVNVYFFEW